jgi:hypothetical protein
MTPPKPTRKSNKADHQEKLEVGFFDDKEAVSEAVLAVMRDNSLELQKLTKKSAC